MSRYPNTDRDELLDDLEDDHRTNTHIDLLRRVRALERGNNTPEISAGERTLAKAQQAARRNRTPDGLLDRAQRVFSDPTSVGAVAGYLELGQVAKAAELIEHAEARQERADEDEALEAAQHGVGGDLVTRLTDELAQTKSVLSAVLRRVGQLEEAAQRPQVPAPTVAKAQQGGRQGARPRNSATAQELLTRADGVVDSPELMGRLSSMVQAGQLREVERIVSAHELAHESRVKTLQRRAMR